MAQYEEQICEKTGKTFIEHEGDKFWFWKKRRMYASQKGGKLRLLHRILYGNGDPKEEVIPSDGDFKNLAPENWILRKKGAERRNTDRSYQEFDDKRFYERPDNGYWWSKTYGSMHRYVWIFHHSLVPNGYVIHHKNRDKSDNRIENLELMTPSDHSKLHAKTNTWSGSEANKMQLREAQKKRWPKR